MSTDTIEVEARVSRFIPNAMHDHFESGASASYDATELEILAPTHLSGNLLTIVHSRNPPPTSHWRELGRELRFTIKEADLASDNSLFDGALSDVRDR